MKLYLRTFGCRANQYDTEAVRELALASGCEIVNRPDEADFAVFNSCAVTAEAEADLRQSVRRASRRNPALKSVVMGCAAARSPVEIAALPTVGAVIPAADITAIADALRLPNTHTAGTTRQSGARALLRIQDGCNEHCTFCATTLARGAARSRLPSDLVAEATRLAERHQEIVLTGVHIGHYGNDLGGSLGELVELLLLRVPGVRLRLSSVEATEVDDRLRELLRAGDGRLAPHLHAPLQSGSDRMLRRMGRHWYTADTYRRAVERLTEGLELFALGADIICGFPGESDDDHAATARMIEDLPFTYLHVFPYSPRPGTAATRLTTKVRESVVGERCHELRSLGLAKAARYEEKRSGGAADVLVISAGGKRRGLTEDYLSVRLQDTTLQHTPLAREMPFHGTISRGAISRGAISRGAMYRGAIFPCVLVTDGGELVAYPNGAPLPRPQLTVRLSHAEPGSNHA